VGTQIASSQVPDFLMQLRKWFSEQIIACKRNAMPYKPVLDGKVFNYSG
jgi:hypothetical protein